MTDPSVPPGGRPLGAERDEIARTVGARLRELRAEYGLSLRDVERRSGVTRSTVSRLERGLRRPRASLLGWIAYALDPDRSADLCRVLCAAAGLSLIAESRWSVRTHERHAERALTAGELPLPVWLAGPFSVALFGGVMPDRLDVLIKGQEVARNGGLPWPDGAQGSPEALAVGNMLCGATPSELARIGRAYAASGRAQVERQRRKRARERGKQRRELHASLGLPELPRPRPRSVRRKGTRPL